MSEWINHDYLFMSGKGLEESLKTTAKNIKQKLVEKYKKNELK